MKNKFFKIILLLFSGSVYAQQTGDTIFVKAYKYGSTTHDSVINFPSGNLTFEKIIMKYNMRCKNNLISTQAAPNQGCGEWDYSCNTYIVDSSKIDNALNKAPNYIISGFTGTTFPYTSQPVFDYYNFLQNTVTLNNIVSETQYTLGTGAVPAPNVLKTNERSGRSQILYTAAELTAAGLSAGNIDGFILNVTAAGSANFFKVGIQQTTLSALSNGNIVTSGFTNVFNNNRNFVLGNNRVQFYTPFVWNGTSNIIIDLSFTNTNPVNPVVFSGTSTGPVMALYSKNNYAVDLSNLGHINLSAPSFSSISNEITVSFWAYGNAGMLPANTVLLYGYGANAGQRNFNLHLPWSDNNMYFDCGYAAGGFDRINKAATAAEQGGQWNHWAFTKNATTGNMNIYLNGVLWHSGTALTKPMSILNMILGKDQAFNNNWKGKLNELTIWNKALSLSDIQGWMNKSVDNTHPFYNNLVAYYKLNEGTGLTIADTKNSLNLTGVNLQWTYDRGNQLNRLFAETNVRPNLTFVRGTYALSTATIVVKDSVQRNANIVQNYSVVSNATAVPMANDLVNLVSTTNLYQSLPSKVYDGDTGLLTGTVAVASTGTLNIVNMNYYKRYPYFNEIMSFVTPYGKGLDLGPKGKSWYYDVTDFTPLLKGPKRLVMAFGDFQEQMDIDFWFIVGTPPRNVLQFDQLWQGAAVASDASIGSINNDTRFPLLTKSILPNAQSFKLRSTITGHGSQGEFSQNGGLINHNFNIAGGAPEFTWQITQVCSTNPIVAQGGTWIYPRQGWCPGQASLLKEFNLTPYITPGNTVTLDYGCSNPPNPSGDYRYIVANQLVSYGAANQTLDARVEEVLQPSDRVLYSKTNPICSNPVIVIRNTGSTALTSAEIDYWVNNAPSKETYTWTGNLAFMDTAVVTLPINSLWQYGTLASGNKFHVDVKRANAAVDNYTYNNVYTSAFDVPPAISNSFTIVFKTNNNPLETTYTLTDDLGNIAGTSNFSTPNTVYTDTYELNGCLKLRVDDAGGDGLQWWANAAQGAGYVQIKNSNGAIVKTFLNDFGSFFEFSFTTYNPLAINKNELAVGINIFPNPAHNKFVLQGNDLENAEISVSDLLGRVINLPNQKNGNVVEFNTQSLIPGMYLVSVTKGNQSAVKKLIIE